MIVPDTEAEALSQAIANVAHAASAFCRGARRVSGSSHTTETTICAEAEDWADLLESVTRWNEAGEAFIASVRKRAAEG